MKSMMRRTTRREIRQSLGRYIAIMAIIALGVGFFAGLKVTKPTMIQITDAYLQEHQFFDYRLLSTYGFDAEDVEAFAAEDGVAAAEGSLFCDVLFRYGDEEGDSVASVHSLTEQINTLKLTAGRLPQAANECVVDSLRFSEDAIGQELLISEDNTQDTLEMMAYDSYTIVGIVASPLYINFERGSTSIGNGVVSGFAYMPLEGFSADYFSEIYLQMDIEAQIYADEYVDYMEAHDAQIEAALDERTQLRYDELVSEAQAEIDDAQKEIDDAQAEVDTHQAEIDDGWAQLEEMQQMTLSAEELAFMPESVQLQAAEAAEQMEEARAELESSQEELDEARQEIADAVKELEDAKEELASLEPVEYYLLDRNTNIGYASFENDSSIVEGIADVFPIFFFLVAALVCITTMNRMVEEQRTQIGVLKALGYGTGTIMGKYMTYSGSAAMIGCVLGFLIGSYVFPNVIWTVYGIMYSVGGNGFVLDVPLAVISVIVSLLCSIGTTWLSCRYELGSVAAELIRPKSPKSGKRILLERIPWLWKRLKFLHKVSIRNIFRYKKRFFMMVIGIGGCMALVLTGLGINDSIADVVTEQYDRIQTYDISVTFKDAPDESGMAEFDELTGDVLSEKVYYMGASMDLTSGSRTKAINVIVPESLDQISEFLHLADKSGAEIAYPSLGEAVITQKYADKYKIRVGDTVTVRDGDMQEMELVISGICSNYVYNYLYVSAETYQQQMGEPADFKYLWCNVAEGTEVHAAGTRIMAWDNVVSTSITADMKERIGAMMSSLNYVVFLVIGCAAALAFIVLYNLTNINITERIREIATIKVLGFFPGETASYVFRENLVLTAIGAVAGIPLGQWLHRFVMSNIDIDAVSFQVKILPVSYVFGFALTLVFAMAVNCVMYFKLERINMAESLKSIE